MNSRKLENGEREWGCGRSENAYNDYMERIASECEDPQPPPKEVQMQVWTQVQGVSKKGTVYGLGNDAVHVRPNRSRLQSNSRVDPETNERLSRVEAELQEQRVRDAARDEQLRAEAQRADQYLSQVNILTGQLAQFQSLFNAVLSRLEQTGINLNVGTSQPSQSTQPGIYSQPAGMSLGGISHIVSQASQGISNLNFMGMSQPNNVPLYYNLPNLGPRPQQHPNHESSQDNQLDS